MDAIVAAALEPSRSFPLGASLVAGGANFSVFSKHASAVQLLLFDDVNDEHPSHVIDLAGRTHHYWHTFVPFLAAGQLYAYRAHGPYAPEQGLRFDADKVLLDPYGKCVAGTLKSVVADPDAYDWEDDCPPHTPFAKTIIYELHVGNFTRHPNSGIHASRRGTFAGLIEKLPYLHDLGVTALELLPVFAFAEDSAPRGLRNVWGYQPHSFFAPHPGYSSRREPLGALDELSLAVQAHETLVSRGIRSRVVSMPSWDVFESQPQDYRDSVLPPQIEARVAIEQASTFGWERYVGRKGRIIGMHTFGASAPLKELQRKFGFEPERVVAVAQEVLG